MRTLLLLIFVVVAVVAGLLWMAQGVQGPRAFDGSVYSVDGAPEPSAQTTSSTLSVVVWNVAWGYGRGSEGRAESKPAEHFERTLDEMARVLREADADLVFLQEVDFDCTRSHGTHQARVLAREGGYPFVAEATSWVANWVPFPYWPPSAQFGRMRSGGAVLSRYPIEHNEVTWLPKPDENPFWYNLFSPFRYHQEVGIRWHGAPVTLFNAHLEAFSVSNRQDQASRLVDAILQAPRPLLVGGDLNALPPEADPRSGFEDEPEVSYENDRTVALLRSVEDLRDAFPPERYDADPEEFATFPAHAPNRKLDHLLFSPEFETLEARVLRSEAGELSDHLPLLVRLRPARPRPVD